MTIAAAMIVVTNVAVTANVVAMIVAIVRKMVVAMIANKL